MTNVAIITGASRGIGAATARLLAVNGYAVCVNYNSSATQANALVDEINKLGGKAIAIKADMAKEQEIIAMFNQVDNELGEVNALVNNAGINGGIRAVEEIDAECLESVFATNVFGIFYSCREAIKRMKKIGNGGIVNISSEAAKFGGNKLAHYAASKAAINTFTIGFAREVAGYNIRVNTISPGVIDTEVHLTSPPDRLQMLKDSLPMKRMGSSDEVAQSVLWLLSDKASYVSGSIIPVAGGR